MDLERKMIVAELKENFSSKEIQTFLNEKLKPNWKNSEHSQKLRKEGNDLYAKASNALQMEEIYKLYSQSIAFAESDSEDLAFAYGNRSAVLFRMKKYEECIGDINQATTINNSLNFKIRLLCRKIECLNLQGSSKNEEILLKVESLISAMNDCAVKEGHKKGFEKAKSVKAIKVGKSKEKEIPSHAKILKDKDNENPFDSVSIKWSKTYGRYLVANRDFNAGEIVFIEKPYVKVINLKNFHKYCGHCLASCWATIPCNYCSWCMFCSEKCKKKSWEQYHNIECNVVSKIINERDSISHYEQLTIRTLLLGIKDAGSIQILKSQLEDVDACTEKTYKGFKTNGSYKSMGFQSMYTLNDDVSLNRLPPYTKNSVLILLSLIKFTSLFDSSIECNLDNLLANDEVLFIGSLILKIYKINDKNCQQLPGEDREDRICKYTNDSKICHSLHCCNSGFSNMTIGSLINNSCHPQVINIINKQLKFIVCSLRPIKKDSQIFITYCGNFFDMPKDNRQHILRNGFNFTCNCEACENNWPTIQELMISMQTNPAALHSLRTSKEKYHAYANDATIRPFIEYNPNAVCTLNIIETLSKAITNAYKDLKHPSLALFKLEKGMDGALRTLYESSSI